MNVFTKRLLVCLFFPGSTIVGQTCFEIGKLSATDLPPAGMLGTSLSADGSRVLTGAPWVDQIGDKSGAAYLFDANTGLQLAKLFPVDGAEDDRFGTSVALDGTTALVGATGDDDNGPVSGSAYRFDTTAYTL
jgi:hypothetical protein